MEQGNVQDVKRRFSVGFVGIGQGGSSVAQTLAKRFDIPFQNVVALNLSDADLRAASLIPESNRILLDKNRFGAGKNRDL
jgi:hypothetical protein